MALSYHCFCVYCACYACPFWLMLNSSFLNIKDFTLSELRYMIFTKSKLLSFCSCSGGQGFSSCWTSCTNPPLFGNLWPCSCLCADLHTTLKWLALPQLLDILPCVGNFLWEMPCTAIFAVLGLSIPTLPSIVMTVLDPSNTVKCLVFPYMVQHFFFCFLHLYPMNHH